MKSLRSLLSVAVILAFVSPVVTEAKTDINKSPPTITIAPHRILYGSVDDAIAIPNTGETSLETITTSASMDKEFAPPTIGRSKMTGSTDGKSVNDSVATLAGTNPYIVLYLTTAVQRTMVPAMKDCSEAIMRAPRGSARSGPFQDFPLNSRASRNLDLR